MKLLQILKKILYYIYVYPANKLSSNDPDRDQDLSFVYAFYFLLVTAGIFAFLDYIFEAILGWNLFDF